MAVRLGLVAVGVVDTSYVGIVGLAAVVVIVAWLDLRRNTETVLYANLAVSPVHVSVIVVVVTLLLELMIGTPLSGLLPSTTTAPAS